jgi:hypothetical protein
MWVSTSDSTRVLWGGLSLQASAELLPSRSRAITLVIACGAETLRWGAYLAASQDLQTPMSRAVDGLPPDRHCKGLLFGRAPASRSFIRSAR